MANHWGVANHCTQYPIYEIKCCPQMTTLYSTMVSPLEKFDCPFF